MRLNNGGGGIRTLVGGISPETVFETAAFNRSATPPGRRSKASRSVWRKVLSRASRCPVVPDRYPKLGGPKS